MHRTLNARGVTPAGAGPAPVQAAEEMERLAELLLNAAAREQVLRRLGEAVEQSSRLLRTLESRVVPALRAECRGGDPEPGRARARRATPPAAVRERLTPNQSPARSAKSGPMGTLPVAMAAQKRNPRRT